MTRVRRRFFVLAALVAVANISTPHLAHGQVAVDPSTDWDPTAADLTREWSDEVPAHISYATEESWLDREGTVEAMPLNVPLLTGDRLRTGEGRIEVIFSDGSVLSLDRHTDAEFLSDTLLRLDRGVVRLELARGTAGYRIDAAGTTSWARTAGEFIVEIDTTAGVTPAVRLLVVRGTAELESNGTGSLVEAGYEVWASAETTPSLPRAATVAGGGDFARWWDDRRLDRTGYQSASYLPTELDSYGGVLESSGDWEYDTDYGQVWYPRVATEWTPYSTGRWSYVGSYGWTWIGADRWAWPTHHYGRWGHRGDRYYWIPGRHWAPAWVAWASTPSYFGWVPLGFNNRPLISIHIGYSSGWRGWTYHPIDHFRTRVVVVNRGHYLPRRNVQLHHVYTGPTRPAVSVRAAHRGLRGPVRGTVAVPRTAVSRAAGAGLEPGTGRAALGTGGARISRAPALDRPSSSRTTGAPSRTRAVPRIATPSGGVDRTPARAAVGGARGAGAGAPGAITRAPSRRIDAPRAGATPARSRATGAPVRGVNRATAPSTVAPDNRAIRRAAPRTIAPGARQQGAVRQAPASRAGASPARLGVRRQMPSRAPQVIAPRVNRAPARTAPPTINRAPARTITRAPRAIQSRQVAGAGARAPRPRVITRAPTRTIDRAPAPRIQRAPTRTIDRAPAPRPARVQAPASRSSGGGGGGASARPSTRSGGSGSGESRGRAQARPR